MVASRQAKVMRSESSYSDRTVLCVASMSTDNGFSEIAAGVGQCSPSEKAGPSRVLADLARVKMPPLEKLTAQ